MVHVNFALGNIMQILLVDDHTLFREALLHVLQQLAEHVTVLEASSTDEAKQIIAKTPQLDIILLDIDLPGGNGLNALPDIRQLAPTVPVVVLSGSENVMDVQRALDNCALGYLPKSCNSNEMLTALNIILQGDVFVPQHLLDKLDSALLNSEISQEAIKEKTLLTARQVEVLEMLAKGLSNKAIANQFHLTESTVKHHVTSILQSLGARNRTHAVTEASRIGLITINEDEQE